MQRTRDANIIFGAVIDDTLGDEVRVTVIAAGFDGGEPPAKKVSRQAEDISGTGEIPGLQPQRPAAQDHRF